MKRQGNLLPRIVERDNLLLAFWKASASRRASRDVVAFQQDLDGNLARMAVQIADGSIEVGRFTSFEIRDPKARRIFAPCFEERVLHHAIMNVAGERLDRYLIDQTYACRVGRGTHAAIAQAQQYARQWPFVLQLDVRHYFDCIDHEGLLAQLARLWKDKALLALCRRIVRSYEVEPGRGLPIGTLTSQHFANVYLGTFDHFAKGELQCQGYVRYMDDVLLFGPGRAQCREWLAAATAWLRDRLLLDLKPPRLRAVAAGFDFLGACVRPSHVLMTGSRQRRWATSLRRLCRALAMGRIDEATFGRRSEAMVAHAEHVASRSFRVHVLMRLATDGVLVG